MFREHEYDNQLTDDGDRTRLDAAKVGIMRAIGGAIDYQPLKSCVERLRQKKEGELTNSMQVQTSFTVSAGRKNKKGREEDEAKGSMSARRKCKIVKSNAMNRTSGVRRSRAGAQSLESLEV